MPLWQNKDLVVYHGTDDLSVHASHLAAGALPGDDCEFGSMPPIHRLRAGVLRHDFAAPGEAMGQ